MLSSESEQELRLRERFGFSLRERGSRGFSKSRRVLFGVEVAALCMSSYKGSSSSSKDRSPAERGGEGGSSSIISPSSVDRLMLKLNLFGVIV
jgi:hypothetical protein